MDGSKNQNCDTEQLFCGHLIEFPKPRYLSSDHQRDIFTVLSIIDSQFEIESSKLSAEGKNALKLFCSGQALETNMIRQVPSADLSKISKLFTKLFHALNAIELAEIIRRNKSESGRKDTIQVALSKLTIDMQPSDREKILKDVSYVGTFTAHPTEAKRPSIVSKIKQIVNILLSSTEDRENLSFLIESLLKNPEMRRTKPSIRDEARYNTEIVVGSLPEAVTRLFQAVIRNPTLEGATNILKLPLVRFRGWEGGDRDGNPNATAEEMEKSLEMRRSEAFTLQLFNVEKFLQLAHLMVESDALPASKELYESLENDRKRFPQIEAGSKRIEYDRFPFFRKLLYLREKLREGQRNPEALSASEFEIDINLIHDGLQASPYGKRLLRNRDAVQLFSNAFTFGLHFATLDTRQHAKVHRDAYNEVRSCLPEHLKHYSLEELIKVIEPNAVTVPDTFTNAKEIFGKLDTIKKFQKTEPRSVQTYIVSMTTASEDLLLVLFFLRLSGLFQIDLDERGNIKGCKSSLDIVPLFETIEDLEKSESILSELFSSEIYQHQLTARDRHQEIMLGYSDSNKDGGKLAASVGLHRAIWKLSNFLQSQENIRFTYFHGRGGSSSRGGGRTGDAIKALPYNYGIPTVRNTEQGEVISSRYSHEDIAFRHLDQIVASLIEKASGKARSSDPLLLSFYEEMVEPLKISQSIYNELVEDAEFYQFFTTATPIHYIRDMNMGSRPAARGVYAQGRIKDLRAIPWVFAFQQIRLNLSGWYGVGSGLHAFLNTGSEPKQKERLQYFYKMVPAFKGLIDDVERDLARAQMKIAKEYIRVLCNTSQSAEKKIEEEFKKTKDMVFIIKQYESLLEDKPKIAELITLRNKFTDPLNIIQCEFIRRERSESLPPEEADTVHRGILRTIAGVAAALQSTG